MKKLFLILFLFAILINLAYAAEINVKDTPVKSVVLPGQNAIFDVNIENTQSITDDIKIAILDINWRRQEGVDLYMLSPGEEITERFTLFSLGYLNPGVYALPVRFVSTKNPEIFTDHQFVITIVDYKKAISANLETNPEGIDPRKENLIRLNLDSNYNIDLENINIHIENSLFTKDLVTSLNGLESKTEEFIISLNPETSEGDYETKLLITYNNEVLVDTVQNLKVSSYSNVKETITEDSGFLSKQTTVTRVNNGNSLSNEVYSVILSGFQKAFTKFDVNPSNIEETEQGYKHTWLFPLQPGEQYSINIGTDYATPLLWLIIILLVIWVAYKYLRTDLYVNKKVLILRSQEGHIAGVKVLLRIKSNAGNIKHLHITDIIPESLEMPHEYITLKPSMIRKGDIGSTVIWEIPELVKGEERVISYKLKSKTAFKGKLHFEKAVCRYKNNLGRLSVARSNEVTVYS